MKETYEQMRERHAKEVRDWVHDAFAGGKSINTVSRETGVNVGTVWRLEKQHGKKEETT
jgi:hypothetical protein